MVGGWSALLKESWLLVLEERGGQQIPMEWYTVG